MIYSAELISFLAHCICWQKFNRTDQLISYLGTHVRTGIESIVATFRKRYILFVVIVVRMNGTTLPMCFMLGNFVRVVVSINKWGVSGRL